MGDAGLTGRKIIVDTYGGMGRHGGGAFSGKDPTKVDRSAAYAARWVAKNVVAAGLARRCEIQIAYAIGVAEPVSIRVDAFGTSTHEPDRLEKLVRKHFDLTPRGIIESLELRRPPYLPRHVLPRPLRPRRLPVGAHRQGRGPAPRRGALARWTRSGSRRRAAGPFELPGPDGRHHGDLLPAADPPAAEEAARAREHAEARSEGRPRGDGGRHPRRGGRAPRRTCSRSTSRAPRAACASSSTARRVERRLEAAEGRQERREGDS